jgi:hypothetical protein
VAIDAEREAKTAKAAAKLAAASAPLTEAEKSSPATPYAALKNRAKR